MMTSHLGVDFGTANSSLAAARTDGTVRLAQFSDGDGTTSTFKSVIYFGPRRKGERGSTHVVAGPQAVREYLESEARGRLIQSVKSYLPSRSFTQTQIFGRYYTIEELVAIILRKMREVAAAQFGPTRGPVVMGRPVRFVGEEDGGEELALTRLKAAAAMAGFEDVVFEFEPIAAAFQYESGLDHDELVLIGDFGGGTSDFSLLRLGPSRKSRGREDVLGAEGAPVAGDTFDGKVVRRVVAPKLGLGSTFYSLGKKLTVPSWIYSMLESWHLISFLKTPRTLKVIKDVMVGAAEPEKLQALYHLIQEDQGYDLFRAVEATKVSLSTDESAAFEFRESTADMKEVVGRGDFEIWIQPEIQKLSGTVDSLLDRCGVTHGDVDSVFLTGGSSLVPAVRRLFESKFGAARVKGGGELTSVAKGLALRAATLG